MARIRIDERIRFIDDNKLHIHVDYLTKTHRNFEVLPDEEEVDLRDKVIEMHEEEFTLAAISKETGFTKEQIKEIIAEDEAQ